jgi:hypothetical protein
VGWWDPHLLGFNESVLRAFVQTETDIEREREREDERDTYRKFRE